MNGFKSILVLGMLLVALSSARAQEGFTLPNSATGTVASKLVKVVVNGGVPQAQITATTDTSGAVGIAAPDPNSGAGTSGNVAIVRSGIAPCVFDNTTVAGDFVQIASGVAADCHDAGATRPTTGQIIGIVIQTGGAAGTYNVLLDKSIFPAAASASSCVAVGSSDSLTAAGTFVASCSFPSPVVGSIIEVNAQGVWTSTTGSPILQLQVNAGGTSGICPQVGTVAVATGQTNGLWNLHCVIQIVTTGAPGTAWAWGTDAFINSGGGNFLGKVMGNGTSTASFTTTSAQNVTIGESATMVAGQSITLQSFTVR